MEFQVRDPVHNFISLREREVGLIDTRAMQRLRRISQLAMANLVYPGATHTRFDHSLGVAHVAGMMAQELGLDPDKTELVRFAALLHDIGHGPFSHVSENALEVFADRSTLRPEQQRAKIHELISARIIQADPQIVSILADDTCTEVVRLLSEGHGEPALRSIVSGPLDADKQDYLLRDSHFCGVPYGIFDIHQLHRSLILFGPADEKQLMIRPKGIHAVEQYVLAKYYLTYNVYRHKVRLITDQMITRAITLGIERDNNAVLRDLYTFDNTEAFVERYVSWDDGRLMQRFCVEAPPSKCKDLLERLRVRRLLKQVLQANAKEFQPEVRDVLLELMKPCHRPFRTRIEDEAAGILGDLTGKSIDPDLVIVYAYDIRSVKETSKNDEKGILVAHDQPAPFVEDSRLFASISGQYAEAFIEVYAPVEWATPTDKMRRRREAQRPLLDVINRLCLELVRGGGS